MAGRRARQTPRAGRARSLRDRREEQEFRRRLLTSAAGHAIVLALVAFWPAPAARPLPAVVTVDLVASLPGPRPSSSSAQRAAPKPAPKPVPAPKPPPKPIPKPPPEVVVPKPPPPPPPPKPAKQILPKDPKPVPDKPAKVERRPRPRPKREEMEYDDALAALRKELGESAPEAAEVVGEAAEDETAPPDDLGGSGGGAGVPVPPEVARWIIDTKRHIRSTYVTPPEFLNRGLVTCMEVFLSGDGRVIGEPRVSQSSGDVFWDDNAVRATLRASPLPAPPEEGDWTFCYPTEERD